MKTTAFCIGGPLDGATQTIKGSYYFIEDGYEYRLQIICGHKFWVNSKDYKNGYLVIAKLIEAYNQLLKMEG